MASDEAAIEINKISWEYAEKTIHGHVGWVQMATTFSEDLEKTYQSNPSAVLRMKIPNVVSPNASSPNGVIWKFDLGSMTQRRLLNGRDQCTRRIRRIYYEDNSDGGIASDEDRNLVRKEEKRSGARAACEAIASSSDSSAYSKDCIRALNDSADQQ
jgi:hypothetical protein